MSEKKRNKNCYPFHTYMYVSCKCAFLFFLFENDFLCRPTLYTRKAHKKKGFSSFWFKSQCERNFFFPLIFSYKKNKITYAISFFSVYDLLPFVSISWINLNISTVTYRLSVCLVFFFSLVLICAYLYPSVLVYMEKKFKKKNPFSKFLFLFFLHVWKYRIIFHSTAQNIITLNIFVFFYVLFCFSNSRKKRHFYS